MKLNRIFTVIILTINVFKFKAIHNRSNLIILLLNSVQILGCIKQMRESII